MKESNLISVIIPTLNQGSQITVLLDKLIGQSLSPAEIIVVDSQSDDGTPALVSQYIANHTGQNIRFIGIERKDFDHGATRDMALRESNGDFVLFLTQDAMPANEHYIENLMKPFSDEKVAFGHWASDCTPGCTPCRASGPGIQLSRTIPYP